MVRRDAASYHLGGVAAACDPSGGRGVWTWGTVYGPSEALREGAPTLNMESAAEFVRRNGSAGVREVG